MKNYKEFIISSIPFVPELLQGICWQLNISGIQEEDNYLKVFSESNKVRKDDISRLLQSMIKEGIIESFRIEEQILENINWNEEWEKSREVMVISDRVVIKPSFKNYNARPNQIIITIDPKMSFGTGEHQSTKLSLMFLEKYVKNGMNILDVGTGTGVLAIAAVKLGGEKVVAIDFDEWSYTNSIENCEINSVKENVDVRLCEINNVNEGNFDLIVANIQRDVLLQIKLEIRDRIKNDGILILAGLLSQDRDEIQREYEALKFSMVETQILDEWISMVFQLKY